VIIGALALAGVGSGETAPDGAVVLPVTVQEAAIIIILTASTAMIDFFIRPKPFLFTHQNVSAFILIQYGSFFK
jgi:hypothetical protein